MGVLSWIVIGLAVGIIASILTKRRGLRLVSTLVVSVIGAVLGGMDVAYLYRVPGAIEEINRSGLIVALVGALFALALLRLLVPQNKTAV